MPTPIPFADDGGTPAWRARHAPHPLHVSQYGASCSPLSRYRPTGVHGGGVLAGLDVLPGRFRTAGRVIALVGIAAPAAFIRRHTGMALGAALSLVALVGLAGLVWVAFALLAVALMAGV